ncbi:MAG: hypothetical protein KatS3mg009_2906 [Acidimicrobiia bacterium]|nr:MAG: hypothetical protein KatS3mg009_2906 [Acidimicrobiia bacterium]
MSARDRHARLSELACIGGGGALLASAFVHWLRRGPGHTLRGHELVDAVVALGGTLPGLTAARLTVLWYLVPLTGALAWVACGLWGAGSRVTRGLAVVAAVVTTLVVGAFVWTVGTGALGPGPYVAAAGAAAVLGGSWASARMAAPGP